MSGQVRLERDGAVATIRLDRPKVNALGAELVDALTAVCASLARDPEVRAAVVYGGEKVFSAGADLKEMEQAGSSSDIARYVGALGGAIRALEDLPFVTIAAVNGFALGGGCEITLGCDFRMADPGARFGQPEISVGLIPGAGATQRLPRLVGPARAKHMIYTGDFVDAATAMAWGLVDEVTDEGAVYDRALEVAQRYASGPTLSLAAAKRAVNRGLDGSFETGLELELREFTGLFSTEDTRHGLGSFASEGPGKATFRGR